MLIAEIIFWASLACVAYAYAGYPLLTAGAALVRPRRIKRSEGADRTVSIVIAAHNEEHQIGRRIRELANIVEGYPLEAELILVSDGSTDRTALAAREATTSPVRVIELQRNVGKASALNVGCAAARHDILVFGDVRQTWSTDAVERLVENFADPEVGAVSGDLTIQSGRGTVGALGIYWRYEKWLRLNEGRVRSLTGVTGSISAVRRELYEPLPHGTLVDDMYWPLRIAMRGYRIVHDERAKAFDCLPARTSDEFRRKVRTLSGNYQLLAALPAALLPWKNRVWLQFVSHKVLRLAAPWALVCMLAANGMLVNEAGFYRVVFASQLGFYLLAMVGLRWRAGGRAASFAASFVVLNSAAWLAFWLWISGRAVSSWQKTSYSATDLSRGEMPSDFSTEIYGAQLRCDTEAVL